jgi:NodT family efflux transporter outer membrane factor (OMF) lipoprotein
MHPQAPKRASFAPLARMGFLLIILAPSGGCTSFQEWVHNGFKVGPNFQEPMADVASDWIDADPHILRTPSSGQNAAGDWWRVFDDPCLSQLIETAYRQNLDLKTAATRVLQAQAQRNIAVGNLFPQSQNLIGDYARAQIGNNIIGGLPLPSTLNVWAVGPNASWELDFWGRLRRSIESSDASMYASVDAYRDALVTLIADVATSYVQVRTYQQRLVYARSNLAIQQGTLRLAQARLKDGKATALDVEQALVNLAQIESSIPPLLIGLRQANDRLCVLLGQSPRNLVQDLKDGRIPKAAPDLAVGIPAELLTRRPDVRRALKEVAAQSAQIGVAQADLYPRIAVSGFIGYSADDIRMLFDSASFTAYILPNFQWKILNYGRIVNNVRQQEARLAEKTYQYQQAVLKAGQEVEDGLAGFLQSHQQLQSLAKGSAAAEHSMELVVAQYQQGRVDYNNVFTTQATLVTLQDQLAVAQGNIALNLIAVYRALGGGWRHYDDHAGEAGSVPAPRLDLSDPIENGNAAVMELPYSLGPAIDGWPAAK